MAHRRMLTGVMAPNDYCSRNIHLQCIQNHRSVKLAATRNSSGCHWSKLFSAGNIALPIYLSGRSKETKEVIVFATVSHIAHIVFGSL